jgi:hypothetical protein
MVMATMAITMVTIVSAGTRTNEQSTTMRRQRWPQFHNEPDGGNDDGRIDINITINYW